MLKIISSTLHASSHNRGLAKTALLKLFEDRSVGFLRLPELDHLFQSVKDRAHQVRKRQPKLILIGIGGSGLGPQLLKDCFDSHNQVYILDNLDPHLLESGLAWAGNLESAHVVVISKSGKTLETLVLAEQVISELRKFKLELSRHVTVITENQPQDLYNFAKANDIPILEIPKDVGGRYSVLTPVGTFLLSFIGQDLGLVRKGMEIARNSWEMAEDLISLSLASFEKKCSVTAFWNYSTRLRFFGSWLQQLWCESLGKPRVQASAFIPLVGAIDQHSVLQQIIEGELSFWSCLIYLRSYQIQGPEFNSQDFPSLQWAHNKSIGTLLNAECLATYEALKQSGKRVTLLELQDLSLKSLSYITMLSQIWVAGLGFALGINPFDQPGVELGKRLIKDLV
jgi:glucose-6-phosphate isomerase